MTKVPLGVRRQRERRRPHGVMITIAVTTPGTVIVEEPVLPLTSPVSSAEMPGRSVGAGVLGERRRPRAPCSVVRCAPRRRCWSSEWRSDPARRLRISAVVSSGASTTVRNTVAEANGPRSYAA